jgi:hypothetical protein
MPEGMLLHALAVAVEEPEQLGTLVLLEQTQGVTGEMVWQTPSQEPR